MKYARRDKWDHRKRPFFFCFFFFITNSDVINIQQNVNWRFDDIIIISQTIKLQNSNFDNHVYGWCDRRGHVYMGNQLLSNVKSTPCTSVGVIFCAHTFFPVYSKKHDRIESMFQEIYRLCRRHLCLQ